MAAPSFLKRLVLMLPRTLASQRPGPRASLCLACGQRARPLAAVPADISEGRSACGGINGSGNFNCLNLALGCERTSTEDPWIFCEDPWVLRGGQPCSAGLRSWLGLRSPPLPPPPSQLRLRPLRWECLWFCCDFFLKPRSSQVLCVAFCAPPSAPRSGSPEVTPRIRRL